MAARLFVLSFVAFLALDGLWLGIVASSFYNARLGPLLRPEVLWPAALLFYVFFLMGLVLFVLGPAVVARSLKKAAGLGAAFGFVTYQTVELTNLALVKDWPVSVAIVDILWGMILATVVSVTAVGGYLRLFASSVPPKPEGTQAPHP